MYDDFETKKSYEYLQIVVRALKDPICILGGWAVFFTVNTNYVIAQGKEYLGSRDIDLGFHVTDDNLKTSPLAHSLNILKKMNFKGVGFRLYKDIHAETGKEIEDEQVQSYQRFVMYVDPIVDRIPKNFKDVFGFQPIDEPMLQFVFEKSEYRTELQQFDKKLLLPSAEILIATKINAIANRDKRHKKIKDICDLFALLWYSDKKHTVLKTEVKKIISKNIIKEKLSCISPEELFEASRLLGNTIEEVKKVVLEEWDDSITS